MSTAGFRASSKIGNFDAAGFSTHESNQVLLVLVHNIIYPITKYELHRVFDPYGYVEKIDILQSSEMLEAIVQFDSCQNAIWAKNQLQGRYIYDRCCQLDIQFYKFFDNENQTGKILMENEFASDLDFIKNEVCQIMVVIERMQDRVKTMNSSIQKLSHTASKSSISTGSKSGLDIMELKSSIRSSSSVPMSLSIIAPAPSPVVSLSSASSKLELSFYPHLKLLERPPTILAALEVCFSATLNAASFSYMMLSTPMKLAPGKVFSSMKERAPLQMFDLMLEQKGRKTFGKKVFIFDPGGSFTKAANLFDEMLRGISDGKYHIRLYMTFDTFRRVELIKRSIGQVVYKLLPHQAALIQPVLYISMLELCPNPHEAASLPSTSTTIKPRYNLEDKVDFEGMVMIRSIDVDQAILTPHQGATRLIKRADKLSASC